MSINYCIGGGSVPNATRDQYLGAFGYAGPWPLSDGLYADIANQCHPDKKSVGPNNQDNWVELAVACMKARAVLFCNHTPGDVATTAQEVQQQLGTENSELGLAAGGTQTALGVVGSLAKSTASFLPIIGDIAGAILSVFTHHAQAEAQQATVLANVCPAASAAIRQVDAAVIAGTLSPSDAQAVLQNLYQRFIAAVAPYRNDCNAFCWYEAIMDCLVTVSTYLYQTPAYMPAPPSPLSALDDLLGGTTSTTPGSNNSILLLVGFGILAVILVRSL